MKHPLLTVGLAFATAAVTTAAISRPAKSLTPQRVAQVQALADTAPAPARVTVKISGIAQTQTVADGHKATLEQVRELRFPIAFDPPTASRDAATGQTPAPENFPVTPTTPTQFETLNTGWTITLTTQARGGLVEIYGTADFVEADLINGGYGALSGPILTDQGIVVTPNRLTLPKTKTTTTRFHVFALPGESYDITLYRGSKPETHTLTVTAN